MVVVLGGIVLGRQVTAGAERVALQAHLPGVWFVTVAASDALRIHPAFEKRAPVVHLRLLLSVSVIERRRQQRREVVVEQWRARLISLRDLAASRMALRAHLDFPVGSTQPRAGGVAAPHVDRPRRTVSFVEIDGQSFVLASP